mgnify:CR=1 FL=1
MNEESYTCSRHLLNSNFPEPNTYRGFKGFILNNRVHIHSSSHQTYQLTDEGSWLKTGLWDTDWEIFPDVINQIVSNGKNIMAKVIKKPGNEIVYFYYDGSMWTELTKPFLDQSRCNLNNLYGLYEKILIAQDSYNSKRDCILKMR